MCVVLTKAWTAHRERERQTKLVRAPKDLFHPRVNRVMQSPFIRSAIHHHTLILETASSACIMRVALVGCPSHTCGGSRGRDFGDLWRDLGRRFCGATMKNCAGKKLTNCVDPRYRARKSTPSMRTLGSVTTGTAKNREFKREDSYGNIPLPNIIIGNQWCVFTNPITSLLQ